MWHLERNEFDPSKALVEESLFTVGNGYIGIRGSLEEGYGREAVQSVRGSYINGLYDRVPMLYGESAYGFPAVQDKQPRIIDTQTCDIYLDSEKVSLSRNNIMNYRRVLDYKAGLCKRSYEYITSEGKRAIIAFYRMASLDCKNLFIYKIEVEYEGNIRLSSVIDADVRNYANENDPRVGKAQETLLNLVSLEAVSNRVHCLMQTHTTGIGQATVVNYHIGADDYTMRHETEPFCIVTEISGKKKIALEKQCFFTDSLRFNDPLEAARQLADRCAGLRFDVLANEQKSLLEKFWSDSDIRIEGDDETQASIRFMLYQLLQSTGTDEFSNVSAKGLSGEGYEGHYFWDTEIYVLPLLQMTQPQMARKLLEYRSHILPYAKSRALELGHSRGAAYPWRTISGIECSGYFPAGTAQYHINADIAYAFIQYHLYNRDDDFMLKTGLEVIIETARIWMEVGHYRKDLFMIHCVTGPDEYTAIVNNNFYTNAMAKYHLKWASDLYQYFSSLKDPGLKEEFSALCSKIGLEADEAEEMKRASERMYLPFDDEHGIHAQDDSFLTKTLWPFEKIDESRYPLLLNFHPLTIYRHQVLKQADTVLAHFLLEDYAIDAIIKASYDYYEKITTHDSSLSACIYGMMAARCGYPEKAYDYFEESLRLDLEDTHKNTKDGLHIANIAGTALSVICGFAGFRIKEDGITLRPILPRKWKGYSFKIKYRGRELSVAVAKEIEIDLLNGDPLEIEVRENDFIEYGCIKDKFVSNFTGRTFRIF